MLNKHPTFWRSEWNKLFLEIRGLSFQFNVILYMSRDPLEINIAQLSSMLNTVIGVSLKCSTGLGYVNRASCKKYFYSVQPSALAAAHLWRKRMARQGGYHLQMIRFMQMHPWYKKLQIKKQYAVCYVPLLYWGL